MTGALEQASEPIASRHGLYLARAHVGTGAYLDALELLEPLAGVSDATGTEALAYASLALSLLGRHDEAITRLEQRTNAPVSSVVARLEALVLACLGLVLQRADRANEAGSSRVPARRSKRPSARATPARSRWCSSTWRDCSRFKATSRAPSSCSKRRSTWGAAPVGAPTARQALLNLANTRSLPRAPGASRGPASRHSKRQRDQLPSGAQIAAARARGGARRSARSARARRCDALRRPRGSEREARTRRRRGRGLVRRRWSPPRARPTVDLGRAAPAPARAPARQLADAPAHKALLLLAHGARRRARGRRARGAQRRSTRRCEAARETGQKRVDLAGARGSRACWKSSGGQPLLARRDREEALARARGHRRSAAARSARGVLERSPAPSAARQRCRRAVAAAATELVPWFAAEGRRPPAARADHAHRLGARDLAARARRRSSTSSSRILEVNSELAREGDLERLTARVTDHAVEPRARGAGLRPA